NNDERVAFHESTDSRPSPLQLFSRYVFGQFHSRHDGHDSIRADNSTVLRRGKAVQIRCCPATVRRGSGRVESDTSRRNNLSREGHHVYTALGVARPRCLAVSLHSHFDPWSIVYFG